MATRKTAAKKKPAPSVHKPTLPLPPPPMILVVRVISKTVDSIASGVDPSIREEFAEQFAGLLAHVAHSYVVAERMIASESSPTKAQSRRFDALLREITDSCDQVLKLMRKAQP